MKKLRTIIIPDLFIIIKFLEEKDKSPTDVQFESKLNYSHLHLLKKGMVEENLIIIIKQGRKKLMSLTDKGKELLLIINQYLEFFNIRKEDMTNNRRTKNNITDIKQEEIKNDTNESNQSFQF